MNSSIRPIHSRAAIRRLLFCLCLIPLGLLRAAPVHEVLASFGSDAFYPSSGNLLLGPDDYYWGTTQSGGAFGYGVIYKVKADGSEWQAVVDFSGNGATNKGNQPNAGLYFDNINTSWGTTYYGGAFYYGTVFRIHIQSCSLTTAIEFTGKGARTKGSSPSAGLVTDFDGNIWDMTEGGGATVWGTNFKINISVGHSISFGQQSPDASFQFPLPPRP